MSKYVALHKKSDRKVFFVFDYFGVLNSISFEGERWREEQVKWFFEKRFHLTESSILELTQNKTLDFSYIEVPKDLSFKTFWDSYAYKVGKIPQTQKLWNALTDAEKIEVLLFIPKYKTQKTIEKTALLYPSSFLNGKPWLAEKI